MTADAPRKKKPLPLPKKSPVLKPPVPKCAYCKSPDIIYTDSHCWDKAPITDMGCYKSFDGIHLHGFAKWKFCPICGQELIKEKKP